MLFDWWYIHYIIRDDNCQLSLFTKVKKGGQNLAGKKRIYP